jgi:uncharacterized metal-binding protein
MVYDAKESVLRSLQNTQSKASTMYNFWMLNLVVRTETDRLWKVNMTRNGVELPVAKTDTFQEINFTLYLGKILTQQLHIRKSLTETLMAN